jgi:hypothetical protein
MENEAPRNTSKGETAQQYADQLQAAMDAVPDPPAINEHTILGGL